MKTQYTFVSMIPHLTDYGYNKLYVDAFVGAMNDHVFVRDEYDGRVYTKRVAWVFASKEEVMPEEACAMVYFTTRLEPIGFLVKSKK